MSNGINKDDEQKKKEEGKEGEEEEIHALTVANVIPFE